MELQPIEKQCLTSIVEKLVSDTQRVASSWDGVHLMRQDGKNWQIRIDGNSGSMKRPPHYQGRPKSIQPTLFLHLWSDDLIAISNQEIGITISCQSVARPTVHIKHCIKRFATRQGRC